MQQHRQHLGPVGIVQLVLLGACLAQNYRVHGFEVAGVGGEAEMDLVAVELAV